MNEFGGRHQSRTFLATALFLGSIGAINPLQARQVSHIPDLWRVALTPTMTLGVLDASGAPALFQVAGAVHLSDGKFVVANGGTSELHFFSSAGRYLSSVGREGDGPGEFRWITSLQRASNDSLFVFDASAQRLSAFSPEGQQLWDATFPVTSGQGLGSVLRLADGVWIGREGETVRGGPPGEIVRDTISFGALDTAFAEFRRFASLPARMTTTVLVAGRRGSRTPAFSPSPVHASWGRCLFVSSGDTREVEIFASDGRRIGGFTGPGSPRTVDDQDVDAWIEINVAVLPSGEREVARRVLAGAARPPELPFYNGMVIDRFGHIWLQEYSPPDGAGHRWQVVSQRGQDLGGINLPKRLRVFQLSEAGILGTSHGELGEELVEFFRFEDTIEQISPPLDQCSLPVP